MTRKSRLGPELKRRFKEQGYSMSRVARELGLFENSLRSWIRRNRYPERELVQLAAFVGLPQDLGKLEDTFLFETTGIRRTHSRRVADLLDSSSASFEEVANVIESRAQEVLRGKDATLEELRLLFRTLGAGSVYACSFFDRLPPEMTSTGRAALGREVAGAVRRGACFVYLLPGANLAADTRATGILGILSEDIIRPQLAVFRDNLAAADPDAVSWQDTRLILISSGRAEFLSPGHHYLFFWQRQDTDLPRLFVRIPISSGETVSSPLLPLSGEVANGFLSMLLAELNRAGHEEMAKALLGHA